LTEAEEDIMARTARCSCGQLSIRCEGEPIRRSMCHCLECQRRTGSAFGAQVRFRADDTQPRGKATEYGRRGDSGAEVRFRFCPICGTTLYWTIDSNPGVIAVALGAFAEPGFGAPTIAVYERSRHLFVNVGGPTESAV